MFEVNASMLVHARNEDFPYKDPYVRAIKARLRRDAARAGGEGGLVSRLVMPGLVPGIHVFVLRARKTWMAGTSPETHDESNSVSHTSATHGT